MGNVNVIAQSTTAKYDKDADFASPLNIAVTVEDTNVNVPTRIVVFGDEDFAENIYVGQGANSDLMLNSIDWVAHQDTLINLTPKDSSVPLHFGSFPGVGDERDHAGVGSPASGQFLPPGRAGLVQPPQASLTAVLTENPISVKRESYG